VHDDVGSEGEGLLDPRCGEGVVDDHDRSAVVRESSHRRDVDDVEERVRRRLDPDHPGLGSEDRFEFRQIRGVDGEPGPTVDDGCKPVGAAVGVGRHHQVVAGVEQSQDGVFGRHPTGEGEPELRSLEQCQMGLEAGAARVARARVLEAAIGPYGVLFEGGRQVDRCVDCSGGRVGAAAAVHGERLEPEARQRFAIAHGLSADRRPRWRARPSA
jgi:hypothetical protein